MFHDSKEGQTHYFGDGCIPTHEPIGEKPGETWEERLYALGNECSFDWDGVPERLEEVIAKEIQSAVEAERRRIDEAISELPYLRNDEGVNELEEGVSYIEVRKVIPIINPKK